MSRTLARNLMIAIFAATSGALVGGAFGYTAYTLTGLTDFSLVMGVLAISIWALTVASVLSFLTPTKPAHTSRPRHAGTTRR